MDGSRSMSAALTNFLGALAIAVVILLGTALPELDDHSAEHTQAADIEQQLKAEAAEGRAIAANQRQCDQERGPQSAAGWTVDGKATCSTRRGYVAMKGPAL